MKTLRALFLFSLICLSACSADPDPSTPQDMGSAQDMSATPDMRVVEDMRAPDMSEDMSAPDMAGAEDMREDLGEPDMQVPGDMGGGMAAPGFGALEGDCQVLGSAQLQGQLSYTYYNKLDFMQDAFDMADQAQLSAGGLRIYQEPNAGGSSKESEVFAFEVLHRCEGASLLKTENEIKYDQVGKITDLLVQIDGLKIGVSVARAFAYMRPYTATDAADLLNKKLGGINESSQLVSAEDKWTKQVLSILAYDQQSLDVLKAEIAQLEPTLKADTIIIVTLTSGLDCWLYTTSPTCMATE